MRNGRLRTISSRHTLKNEGLTRRRVFRIRRLYAESQVDRIEVVEPIAQALLECGKT